MVITASTKGERWIILETEPVSAIPDAALTIYDPARVASYTGFGGGDVYLSKREAELDAQEMQSHRPTSTFKLCRIEV